MGSTNGASHHHTMGIEVQLWRSTRKITVRIYEAPIHLFALLLQTVLHLRRIKCVYPQSGKVYCIALGGAELLLCTS